MYFTKYQDKRKEWRWNLKTANGNIIADSGEGYAKEEDCDRGIELVKSTDDDTPVLTA